MEPMMNMAEPVGLCTSIALQQLGNAIEEELKCHQEKLHSCRSIASYLKQPPSLALSTDSVLHWSSAATMIVAALFMIIAAAASEDRSLILELLVLIVLVVVNLAVARWDKHLRETEVVNHTKDVLHKLRGLLASEVHWPKEIYQPLFRPTTQSITEQWTYRDGHVINLPTALLVKDDVILLSPGQAAPTTVCHFEDNDVVLQKGQTFDQAAFEPSSNPTARQPRKPVKCLLLDTPYIPYLRACLQKYNSKPSSVLEIKRLVCISIIERWVLAFALGVSLLVNVLRFTLIGDDVGDWAEMIITLQVNTILPLMSLSLPLLWIILTSYGNARIVTLFHKAKNHQTEITEYPDDELGETTEVEDEKLSFVDLWEHFRSAFFGPSSHLPRSASLLQGLGTMTSLCCVDKRGILSYPDPTIEKVFFMSKLRDDKEKPDSETSSVFTNTDEQFIGEGHGKKGVTIAPPEKHPDNEDYFPEYHTEVLTLSVDSTQDPRSLQFDETNWERHIHSLKPLGLNILLNTCNPDTVEKYSHFFNHVHSIVNTEDTSLPAWVAHRRCMCQLAYLIGFTDQATQMYETEQQLALYQPVHPDADENHSRQLHKARSFIKKRTPLPHILSVLTKDSRGGGCNGTNQLLTEGTAELVLSLCTDFWDGSDLCSLDDNDRKKILDFYQRAALSSYCFALSYQPMVDSMAQYFDDLYIELPTGGRDGKLPADHDSFGIARSSWDVDMTAAHQQSKRRDDGEGGERGRKYHSLDSAMDKMGNTTDVGECLRAQCSQIFIGMVAMNYQAKSDIVALIENLDHACIRFVHFSRDQELRSRVFSEKMGLEAGWNCHISLQSESNVTTSNNSFSRQHSDHSSSVKSNPSRKSLDVVSSLLLDHSNEVQMDAVNLKVQWQGKEKKTGTGEDATEKVGNSRERTSSGGRGGRSRSKGAEGMDSGLKIKEDKGGECEEEDEQALETSRLLPASSTQSPSPASQPTANESNMQSQNTENSVIIQSGKDNTKDESSTHGEAVDDPLMRSKNTSKHKDIEDDQPDESTKPLLESTPQSPAFQKPYGNPCFAQTSLPNVHVSEEEDQATGQPPRHKSEQGFLSEDMLSLKGRNISETRTMSDDVETLSHVTESETAVGFDIANRAKLPRGIENIRPHLEKYDNVPLLVPLFTDVTPETTQEMLTIMHDYGEVVCCLGSNVNLANMPLFAQADVSIGVKPLYPHICVNKPQPDAKAKDAPHWHTPVGLGSLLTSLPCSLSFWWSNISLISLIREARGLCTAIGVVFTFLMFSLLSITVAQLLASIFLLPPPLSGRHVLWLAVVLAPVLSISLLNSQLNHRTMTNATGKNLKHKDYQMIQLYMFYFFLRFVVTVFVLLFCHALTLHAFCKNTAVTIDSCNVFFGNRNSTSRWNGLREGGLSHQLVLAQNIQSSLLLFFFIVTSVSYVHSLKPLWKKHPFTNRLWCATVIVLLLLQCIYFLLDVRIWAADTAGGEVVSLSDVPLEVWLIALLWPLVILVLGEAVKLIEIRVFVRWQRRTQLQFGTKLGMNSPF